MKKAKHTKPRHHHHVTLHGLKQAPLPKKLWVGGLILGAAYGVYRGIRYFMAGPAQQGAPASAQPAPVKARPVQTKKPVVNDLFPLKIGSSGAKVLHVQQALQKMGAKLTVSGSFDLTTAEQLNTRGLPAVLDEAGYNALLAKAGHPLANPAGNQAPKNSLSIVFNPQQIAQQIHAAAVTANLSVTLDALQKIKDVHGYETVRNEFIKKPVFSKTTNRYVPATSLVNGLLEIAFVNDSAAKEKIRQEFIRMGLNYNIASATWSLTGIMDEKATVYAIFPTMVIDAQNNRIPVAKGAKLGKMLSIKNNMVYFQSPNGQTQKVPYNTIRYTVDN